MSERFQMLLIFVVMLCRQLARASAGDNINKIWEVLSAVVWGASDDGTYDACGINRPFSTMHD